jgi:hypothetical protein
VHTVPFSPVSFHRIAAIFAAGEGYNLPSIRSCEDTIVLRMVKTTVLVSWVIQRCLTNQLTEADFATAFAYSVLAIGNVVGHHIPFKRASWTSHNARQRRPGPRATGRLVMPMQIERTISHSWHREVKGPRSPMRRLRVVGVGHHEDSCAMLVVDRVVVVQHGQPIRRRTRTLGTVITLSRR